jgi:putative PIN family toxin of toxin-antitoxin system
MRVVVDTNLVVSRAIVPHGIPAQILAAWRAQVFELLVSEPILDEYLRVLSYARLRARHRRDEAQIAAIVDEFRRYAVLIEPLRAIKAVEDDPDDDKFLECAVEGGADMIVSGDPHLLRLRAHESIPILTPADFLALLRRQEADEDEENREAGERQE